MEHKVENKIIKIKSLLTYVNKRSFKNPCMTRVSNYFKSSRCLSATSQMKPQEECFAGAELQRSYMMCYLHRPMPFTKLQTPLQNREGSVTSSMLPS